MRSFPEGRLHVAEGPARGDDASSSRQCASTTCGRLCTVGRRAPIQRRTRRRILISTQFAAHIDDLRCSAPPFVFIQRVNSLMTNI